MKSEGKALLKLLSKAKERSGERRRGRKSRLEEGKNKKSKKATKLSIHNGYLGTRVIDVIKMRKVLVRIKMVG